MADTLQEALIKSSIMNRDDWYSVPSAVADGHNSTPADIAG